MHFRTLQLLAIASSPLLAAARYETVSVNVSLPQNNAPLNHTLAYYKLNGTNGAKSQLTHAFVDVPCGACLSVHYTDPGMYPDGGSPQRPVVLLNHGYPESAYIWRKVTPELSTRVPLFVPDRLGYGLSTVCTNETTNEMSAARAILDAVNIVYGKNVSVVLGGHDRGARTMHRAAVSIDEFPEINALGVWMADIVPIVEEYKSFSNPNYSTGYFHWSFLPRGAFALDVIMAYGGGNFVTEINKLGTGPNVTAAALFHADDAFAVYSNFFNQVSVTNASVVDYTSGATTDCLQQVADQAAGRKISMPTHVLYSYYNLVQESGFNVSEIWSNWVDPSVNLTTGPVCCGQGHFIIELAPDQVVLQLNAFLDSLGVLPR